MSNTKRYLVPVLLIVSLMLTGCGGASQSEAVPAVLASAKKISSAAAREIMDSGNDFFLLDVRTQEEYDTEHIDGAVLIPDTELAERISELPQDKNTTILVYCRSGRRSALSAELLAGLGYTAVKDFGGIIDWPYDTVKGDSSAAPTAAEHIHDWQDFDCNNQKCSVCGKMRRYNEIG